MSGLPEISDYSKDQLDAFSKASPAFQRYQNICQQQADITNPSKFLRIRRHQAWMKASLASYFLASDESKICDDWTRQVEQICQTAWRLAELDSEPVALVAMGKMATYELNLSSDIDLMVISQPGPQTHLLKKLRRFNDLIGGFTEDGFCFRLDYDLRPEGKQGTIMPSLAECRQYYWSRAETWERLALVRFRPFTGPSELKEDILALRQRFVFRKFLDYGLFDELRQLRVRIQRNQDGKLAEGQFHLKLGVGGIRDIELYLHALQVIHGGRNPDIQNLKLDPLMSRLVELGLLTETKKDFLSQFYWHLRHLEHQAQIIEDHQTLIIDLDPWMDDLEQAEFFKNLSWSDQMASEILGPASEDRPQLPTTTEDQTVWLADMGYSETTINEVWPELIQTQVKSGKQKDRDAKEVFLKKATESIAATAIDQDLGLRLLRDFIIAARARAPLFRVLLQEEALLKNLTALFGASPYLGGIFSSRPELVDNFLLGRVEYTGSDFGTLLDSLAEQRLLTELIAGAQFLNTKNVMTLGQSISQTADSICRALLAEISKDFSLSEPLNIIALGKWGGQELGVKSDLDFIFVTDNPATEEHAKVAKRFVARLQDSHRGGSIFKVDLRLRPSGNAGPLITTKSRLHQFFKDEADSWQRQSYLKARPIDFEWSDVFDLPFLNPLSATDLDQLRDIRGKLLRKQQAEEIDLKHNPGGLVDIEFSIQTWLLVRNQKPGSSQTLKQLSYLKGCLSDSQIDQLKQNYVYFRTLEQLNFLVSQTSSQRLTKGSSNFQRLAQLYRMNEDEFFHDISNRLNDSKVLLQGFDPIYITP